MRSSVAKDFSNTLRGLLVEGDSLGELQGCHPCRQRAQLHEIASGYTAPSRNLIPKRRAARALPAVGRVVCAAFADGPLLALKR